MNERTDAPLPPTDPAARLRWGVYLILISISVGGITGRILAVNSIDKLALESRLKDENEKTGKRPNWRQQRPFLSGNDRSRWLTVRSLVEHGTYAIDDVLQEPGWDTIDMVRHDGHLYSSKPPLLATLLAGEYWLIHKITGRTLGTHPFEIGRFMLITINVLPLLLAFVALGRLVERFGTTDWGRIFVMAAATLATFLTTFAITLNNHSVAAISAILAVAAAAPLLAGENKSGWRFAAAGLCAAFAAANELPALSLMGLLGLALLWKSPLRTLLYGLPAVLLVGAAFFAANHAAHGQFSVPYSQRSDGRVLFDLATPGQAVSEELDQQRLPSAVRELFAAQQLPLAETVEIEPTIPGKRWILNDDDSNDQRRFALQVVDGENGPRLEVRAWANWYDYSYVREGKRRSSYWRSMDGRSTVDKGEASRARYALHVLVGHHGIFSLTPVWLLTVLGLALSLRQRGHALRTIAAIISVASLACLAFYLMEGEENRNYGGTTSGLRWMFWFAPMWALGMLPAADAADGRRWRQIVCGVLLAFSVLSVSYPTWNPWSHPWLARLTNYLEWTTF
ncbi:MAG: hypothetical protein AB7O62_05630 [Pirellulales bacterium]